MTGIARLKARLLGITDGLICQIEGLEDKPMPDDTFRQFAETLDALVDSVKETVEHGEPVS